MNLGIVILNWNGESLLKKFFPSIVKFTSEQHNLYLIDNGSSDNSVAFIERNYKRVKVIKLDKNYGYAKGYNLGLKEIKEEIICLLNNDVEVTENWTDNILKQFKSEPNTAVIQPKLKNYHNKSMFDYSGGAGGFLDKYGYAYCRGRIYNKIEQDNNQYDEISDIFWACGACFFIRTDIFKKLNGFDELFWAHFEEIDLCWRIQNYGYKIRFNHTSAVYHANGATLSHENPNKTFLNYRNKDKNACNFVNDYKNKLARSLIIIITTLDPDAIVFGGGLSNEIDFLDEIKKITSDLINEPNLKTVFLKPLYGDASGVRGAALLGRNISI